MARKRRLLEGLLKRYGPVIERAFLAAIDDVRANADIDTIIRRLAAGDINGALDALFMSPAVFSRFADEIASAFTQAGALAAASVPPLRDPDGVRVVIRFDARNPMAEQWLRDFSGTAISEIRNESLRAARNFLSAGLEAGNNPRTMALDLVGRYDRKAGKRMGGVIGLTERQEQFVRNAAAQLRGGPADLNDYLQRKLRDKRFDHHVKKAIKDGTPIPANVQKRMVSRYRDNYLRFRGEAIGRTEAMAALHRGRYQAFAQAVADGTLGTDEIVREWQSAGDNRVRESHIEMDGQQVGLYEPYTTPTGEKLLYPGDPFGPPEEIINCRCTEEIRINFLGRLRSRP